MLESLNKSITELARMPPWINTQTLLVLLDPASGDGQDDIAIRLTRCVFVVKRRVGYQGIAYKVRGTRDLFSDRAVTSNESA